MVSNNFNHIIPGLFKVFFRHFQQIFKDFSITNVSVTEGHYCTSVSVTNHFEFLKGAEGLPNIHGQN